MNGQFRIGSWLVQPSINVVSQNGTSVHLEPKVMEVLVCLADHCDEAVSKEFLLEMVWRDTFVTDDALKRCISELRRVFEDDAREPRVIETIPKRGYRLIAPVSLANRAEQTQQTLQQTTDSIVGSLKSFGSRRAILLTSVIVLIIAVVATAVVFYLRSHPQPIDSIAVLPFTGSAGDSDGQLADGITSGLIESLSQVPGLRVMSRNAVLSYKGKQVNATSVGRELHVRAVLIGTLSRSGQDIVLDTELVNATDNGHIWGEKYTTKAPDLLTVQAALAQTVSAKLRPSLTTDAKSKLANPGTSNLEAYGLYVRGRYAADRWYAEGWKIALAYFQQAVAKDPAYPQAYAGVGEAYVLLAHYRSVPLHEGVEKARAAAQRALYLDPNLGEAHCVLGGAAYMVWEWKEAEQETRLCAELDPNLCIAHQFYSYALSTLGRMDEAIAEQKRSLELDPISFAGNLFVPLFAYWSRDYDRAKKESLKILEVEPYQAELREFLADSYLLTGAYGKAAEEYEKELALSGENERAETLRRAYDTGGLQGLSTALIKLWGDPAHPGDYNPETVADIYSFMGDRDNAFLWLNRAFDENDKLPNGNLLDIKVDPFLDNIRPDPRFKACLRRMGFPE